MHHGTIVGSENGARVIDDGDREFGLWATSICPQNPTAGLLKLAP